MASSTDIEKSSSNLEIVKGLQSRLEESKLGILDSRSQFNSHAIDGLEDPSGEAYAPGSRPPDAIAAAVSEHMVRSNTLGTAGKSLKVS